MRYFMPVFFEYVGYCCETIQKIYREIVHFILCDKTVLIRTKGMIYLLTFLEMHCKL